MRLDASDSGVVPSRGRSVRWEGAPYVARSPGPSQRIVCGGNVLCLVCNLKNISIVQSNILASDDGVTWEFLIQICV